MLARVNDVTIWKSSSVYRVANFWSAGTLPFFSQVIQGLRFIFLVSIFFKDSSISFAAYSAVVLSAVIRKILCC
jgi:hypothetical protein